MYFFVTLQMLCYVAHTPYFHIICSSDKIICSLIMSLSHQTFILDFLDHYIWSTMTVTGDFYTMIKCR